MPASHLNDTLQYKPAVLTLTTDPAVREKIHSLVLASKGRSIVAMNANDFTLAIDVYYPSLILIDLAAQLKRTKQDETEDNRDALDWMQLIERCKLLPRTRSMPIVAFGENEVGLLQAKEAGANFIFPVDVFWHNLNQIVDEQLYPEIEYVEGWDDPLPISARKGLEEFNQGEYFEQHELLETAWLAESRPIRDLYQGILQTGVALLQIERNNWAGAIKLFRRGLPKLRALPPKCQGIELAAFRTEMERIHYEISKLGPDKLANFDQVRFPKIKFD